MQKCQSDKPNNRIIESPSRIRFYLGSDSENINTMSMENRSYKKKQNTMARIESRIRFGKYKTQWLRKIGVTKRNKTQWLGLNHGSDSENI